MKIRIVKLLISLSISVISAAAIVGVLKTPFNVQVDKSAKMFYGVSSTGTYQAIVRLYIPPGFFCSGTIIDAHYILTAAHCVTGDFRIMQRNVITVQDMTQSFQTAARPYILDLDRDVALLTGDFSRFASVPVDFTGQVLAASDKVVAACGFPGGGTVFCSGFRLYGNKYFLMRGVGGVVQKGMSGGPVIAKTSNGAMAVVGVNSRVDTNDTAFGPVVGLDQEFGLWH